MRLNLLKVGSFSSRPKRVVWGAAVLAVTILAGAILWASRDNQPLKIEAPAKGPPTSAEYIKANTDYAKSKVSQNDFLNAVNGYIAAAAVAFRDHNYEKTKAILKECINTVPDKSVTAFVYYNLAEVAEALNDKALEKSSLQQVLARANLPGSGVSQGGIDFAKKKLAELQ